MRNFWNIVITLVIWINLHSQNWSKLVDLRTNFQHDSVGMEFKVYDYSKKKLNYVAVLKSTWQVLRDKSQNYLLGTDALKQGLSFIGDFMALDTLNTSAIKNRKFLKIFDSISRHCFTCKSEILSRADEGKIIMINEAHDNPRHRVVLLSLLKELKNKGFSVLAIETLGRQEGAKLDCSSGYYTNEPNFGNLYREAVRLGFRLVNYEDIQGIAKNFGERDSIQAHNIFQKISGLDGLRKTIIFAGYGHISERPIGNIKTMAINLSILAGVNPLTVDQTYFNIIWPAEGDPSKSRIRFNCLNKNCVGQLKFDSTYYDYYLYNEQFYYIHGRPSWILYNDSLHFNPVHIPEKIKPVLVQAYLSSEVVSADDYNRKVPVDQTYYSESDQAWLALKTSEKYKIVMRGANNEILDELQLTAK